MMSITRALTCAAIVAAVAAPSRTAAAQGAGAAACDGRTEIRLDQENYVGLTDRVYVYAPDINSTGKTGGWQRFTLRILVGTYRRPLLLPKAFMKESDLATALRNRSDVQDMPLIVPGFNPAQGGGAPPYPATTVRDGERSATLSIRVSRVVPVSGGTDHVLLVCSTK